MLENGDGKNLFILFTDYDIVRVIFIYLFPYLKGMIVFIITGGFYSFSKRSFEKPVLYQKSGGLVYICEGYN